MVIDHGGQNKALLPMQIELWMVVNHQVGAGFFPRTRALKLPKDLSPATT